MHLLDLIDVELRAHRKRVGRDRLTILETGTIRGTADKYRHDDGWSTLVFAEQVEIHGGEVYSIDLDTSTAERVLRGHGLDKHVRLLRGYSIDLLAQMLDDAGPIIDVLFLDSDNDAELILHEWLIARRLMRTPGLLLVDDVDLNSDTVVKGHQIVPWLEDHGTPFRVETRVGTTLTTGVLVAEL